LVRYLYTGYFLAGCVIAFLVTHIIDLAWGEGHDQVTNAVGALVGLVTVVLGYRNLRLRTLAMECIDELAAVTWPTREETYNATTVVIITSVVASTVVFLMDRFWQYITNLIYLS